MHYTIWKKGFKQSFRLFQKKKTLLFSLQVHLRSAERLRDLCCANRGTFIKVGQHLGALDYLLPEEYTRTLKILHSQAPQSSRQEIEQVIQEDLGKGVCQAIGLCWLSFKQDSRM